MTLTALDLRVTGQSSNATSEYLRESRRVRAAASDLVGAAGEAAFWFRDHPISHFNGKTAAVLVSEGRAEDVLRYIEMLSAGAAG